MDDLTEQLRALVTSGSEEDVRKFLVEHFNELPREAREEFSVELLREALASDLAQREQIVELKKEFLDAAEKLDTPETA